ncbi:MAG: response regulator transcription factor [Fimbriimonadaceae bacterium]|nr:response regulator transcription factor [Fimbriimonadaceae bacterium]
MAEGRILVVEDNPDIVDMLKIMLGAEGYDVLQATDGAQAMATIKAETLDLVILDLMLPIMDGLEVCRRTREFSQVPIIVLTARTGEVDKIVGLNSGADDYVEKPFSPGELIARIRAQLRRARFASQSVSAGPRLAVGDLVLDPGAYQVTLKGKVIDCTRLEFELLYTLAQRPGRVLTREQLLDVVWGEKEFIQPRGIDVHVRRLRLKIEDDPKRPRRLQTVHSVGYKLVPA